MNATITGPASAPPAGQPQAPLLPPQISQDLTDIRPLGASGGFSSLLRARKVGLDVDVVVKRVKKVYHGRMDEKGEARIMTALRHQYLPRIYDLRAGDDGYIYTIMELIPGCTLREYVRARGSLDQKLALKWTRQLCQVLDYMHTRKPKGIIHSDLKPENIMITPQEDICVIDFNASLEVSDDTELEAIGATAGYAAPEQYNLPPDRFPPDHPLRRLAEAAQGTGRISYRTDLYAVGAVAYFMLTGFDPNVWVDGVTPLERYDIRLGDAFRSVIEKAMSPDPAGRYKSAASMLGALNNLTKVDKGYRRWVRQCRAAGLIIGLGLSASIVCLVLGLQDLGSAHRQAYQDLIRQAREQSAGGRYDDCRQTLTQAIELDGGRIEAYLELGAMLYQLGEYQQTIDLLEGVDFRQGSDAQQFLDAQGQVSYLLGSCYYRQEDYGKALENYRLAAEFCPGEPSYRREVAICCAMGGLRQQAEDSLEILKTMGGSAVDLALAQGEIQYAFGEYEDAYTNLLRAAEQTQDSALMGRCYLLAAQCCQRLGASWTDTQIQMLESASARMGVANGPVLGQLAQAYLAKGSAAGAGTDVRACYEAALGCLQQLIDRGTATFDVRYNAAAALQYLDRYDEAEQLLTQLLTDFPADYRVPMQLALLCAAREGNKDASARDYVSFGGYWRKAQQLYHNAAAQDAQMVQLEELAGQLEALGWQF